VQQQWEQLASATPAVHAPVANEADANLPARVVVPDLLDDLPRPRLRLANELGHAARAVHDDDDIDVSGLVCGGLWYVPKAAHRRKDVSRTTA
jgi:hypothetical protein